MVFDEYDARPTADNTKAKERDSLELLDKFCRPVVDKLELFVHPCDLVRELVEFEIRCLHLC